MKRSIILLLALLALACSTEQTTAVDEGSRAVKITSSTITTRVSGTSWEDSDAIGVFMFNEDCSDIYADNCLYSVVDADASPVEFKGDVLYHIDGAISSFIAYYPYSADTPADALSIDVSDQSDVTDLLVSDLVTAGAGTDVGFTFSHLLSYVTLELTFEEYGAFDLNDIKVSVSGVYTSAEYNFFTQKFVYGSQSSSDEVFMSMSVDGDVVTASALLLPGSDGFTFSFDINGKSYSSASTDILLSGKSYSYAKTIDMSSLY